MGDAARWSVRTRGGGAEPRAASRPAVGVLRPPARGADAAGLPIYRVLPGPDFVSAVDARPPHRWVLYWLEHLAHVLLGGEELRARTRLHDTRLPLYLRVLPHASVLPHYAPEA